MACTLLRLYEADIGRRTNFKNHPGCHMELLVWKLNTSQQEVSKTARRPNVLPTQIRRPSTETMQIKMKIFLLAIESEEKPPCISAG
jgi:hypothetical protein